MNENYTLIATKLSPYIHFDTAKMILDISGMFCVSEPYEFLKPLSDLLIQNIDKQITVNIQLTYSNNISMKILREMFQLYAKNKKEQNLLVKWVAEDDEDITEAGEDFKMLVKCRLFELVEK